MFVDAEWTARQNNTVTKTVEGRFTLRIEIACWEDLDYDSSRNLDRNMVMKLTNGLWVKEGRTVIITGANGYWKTYLACAFGNAACRLGFKVKYYWVNRLLDDLMIGRGDGSYNKQLRDLRKQDLLILDDFGISTLDPVSSRDLLEVIDDRIPTFKGHHHWFPATQYPSGMVISVT